MNTFTLYGWEIVPGYDISLAAWYLDWIVLAIVLVLVAAVFSFFFFLGWRAMPKEERDAFP